MLCLFIPPAWAAARSETPIGGDHGAYDGLSDALAWLQEEAPGDAVLYHRALGWHYRFFLYDRWRSGEYQFRWYPSAVYLADNASKVPHLPKFLIQPEWAPVRDLSERLTMRELAARSRYRAGSFTVYEIHHGLQRACDWCVCGNGDGLWPVVSEGEIEATADLAGKGVLVHAQ
jgi:hypothetical protein